MMRPLSATRFRPVCSEVRKWRNLLVKKTFQRQAADSGADTERHTGGSSAFVDVDQQWPPITPSGRADLMRRNNNFSEDFLGIASKGNPAAPSQVAVPLHVKPSEGFAQTLQR